MFWHQQHKIQLRHHADQHRGSEFLLHDARGCFGQRLNAERVRRWRRPDSQHQYE